GQTHENVRSAALLRRTRHHQRRHQSHRPDERLPVHPLLRPPPARRPLRIRSVSAMVELSLRRPHRRRPARVAFYRGTSTPRPSTILLASLPLQTARSRLPRRLRLTGHSSATSSAHSLQPFLVRHSLMRRRKSVPPLPLSACATVPIDGSSCRHS